MYINLTFLIQIGNFFITYIFLKKYFLEPFTNNVQQKKQNKRNLQEAIYQKQDRIKRLVEEKKESMLAFQEFVIQKYDIKSQPPLPSKKPALLSLDKNMLEQSKDRVTQFLVKNFKDL